MFKNSLFKLMLIALIFPNVFFSQTTKDLPNYFPVSPNAASFAKEGLFPVDYSTGKINISVPLYTIKTRELTVPISLNYNSAGIQLDELASWVGLGWNLNSGGAVVRNVKGIPDTGNGVPDINNAAFTQANYNFLYSQYNPYRVSPVDTAYDEFIINAPGLSGTFYFVNNKPIFKDLQNTVVKTSSYNNQLLTNTLTLEITKADGTIYRFGQSLDGYNANETVHNTSDIYRPDYVSSWFLTEIIPPNSKSTNDIISFKYKSLASVYDYQIVTGEQLIDNAIDPNKTATLKSIFPDKTNSSRQFLTSINFNNGIVEFTSNQNRLDLIDDYKLDKISVYNVKGATKTLITEYSFGYDYYNRAGGFRTTSDPNDGISNPNSYNSTKNINSRDKSLKLTQIVNNILNVKHLFEYEGTTLPSRGTTKKDFWGYINANTGNLSPPTRLDRISGDIRNNYYTTVGNGDRTANETLMKSGILQKITYPEGGYSIFEYEANRYIENVTTPTIVNKTSTVIVYGTGCNSNYGPSSASKVFTPTNYVLGSGKLNISFSAATQESGAGNTNAKYDTEYFGRPAPLTSGGSYTYIREFNNSSHTLSATEYRSGNIGAYGCPFTSITASWQENSGSTTTPTVKLTGGLRIKSIKSYDGKNSNPVTIKQYLYENENPLIKEGNGCYVRGTFQTTTSDDILPVFSSSAIFDNNTGGSPSVNYGKVTEFDVDAITANNNGKTEYFYENAPLSRLFDISAGSLPKVFQSPQYRIETGGNNQPFETTLMYLSFTFFKNDMWNQGSLLKTNIYKADTAPNTYKIIRSIVNQYTILKQQSLAYNVVFSNFAAPVLPENYPDSFALPYNQNADFCSGMFYYAVGQTSQGKKEITTTTETEYDDNANPTIQKVTTYSYENPLHYQLTKTETINSKNETLRTQLSYPQDLVSTGQTTEMQGLINLNKIDKPIKTETFINNVQTSESITKFEQSSATGNLLLPREIHSSKGLVETFPFDNANRKVNFTLYDTDMFNGVALGNGNILEYSIENRTPISIIWGYNKSQPIAKVENATYSQISSYVANLQNLSNTGTEADLITALNALRTALPNAMVTTYTYLPLVGVSTITDPKGDKITYTYDSAGRLQFVKDAQGNLISENQYHYKN
ncbi:RHS repeat protein [Flavobacterium endoglycinae]|uniref:RHS repeat protein n=1 Tax=Flavobacterium endoglycinae TaxID=2816357 RepID=A0ABX7QBC6_9FLAO|nr:RHS repeat domain-containing protein [Flavobacterium endoglycinae]QSW87974.1 RHS repeat protein [Flavobacterium endoglycinae]